MCGAELFGNFPTVRQRIDGDDRFCSENTRALQVCEPRHATPDDRDAGSRGDRRDVERSAYATCTAVGKDGQRLMG